MLLIVTKNIIFEFLLKVSKISEAWIGFIFELGIFNVQLSVEIIYLRNIF